MKVCPNCGKRMETDFCGNCGTDLRNIQPEREDVCIDIELNDVKSSAEDDSKAIDIGNQSSQTMNDEFRSATDDLRKAKDDFVKMAGNLAGSLGKLATIKGEQVVSRIDEEIQGMSKPTHSTVKKATKPPKSIKKPNETRDASQAKSLDKTGEINTRDLPSNTSDGPSADKSVTAIAVLVMVVLCLVGSMLVRGSIRNDSSSQPDAVEEIAVEVLM